MKGIFCLIWVTAVVPAFPLSCKYNNENVFRWVVINPPQDGLPGLEIVWKTAGETATTIKWVISVPRPDGQTVQRPDVCTVQKTYEALASAIGATTATCSTTQFVLEMDVEEPGATYLVYHDQLPKSKLSYTSPDGISGHAKGSLFVATNKMSAVAIRMSKSGSGRHLPPSCPAWSPPADYTLCQTLSQEDIGSYSEHIKVLGAYIHPREDGYYSARIRNVVLQHNINVKSVGTPRYTLISKHDTLCASSGYDSSRAVAPLTNDIYGQHLDHCLAASFGKFGVDYGWFVLTHVHHSKVKLPSTPGICDVEVLRWPTTAPTSAIWRAVTVYFHVTKRDITFNHLKIALGWGKAKGKIAFCDLNRDSTQVKRGGGCHVITDLGAHETLMKLIAVVRVHPKVPRTAFTGLAPAPMCVDSIPTGVDDPTGTTPAFDRAGTFQCDLVGNEYFVQIQTFSGPHHTLGRASAVTTDHSARIYPDDDKFPAFKGKLSVIYQDMKTALPVAARRTMGPRCGWPISEQWSNPIELDQMYRFAVIDELLSTYDMDLRDAPANDDDIRREVIQTIVWALGKTCDFRQGLSDEPFASACVAWDTVDRWYVCDRPTCKTHIEEFLKDTGITTVLRLMRTIEHQVNVNRERLLWNRLTIDTTVLPASLVRPWLPTLSILQILRRIDVIVEQHFIDQSNKLVSKVVSSMREAFTQARCAKDEALSKAFAAVDATADDDDADVSMELPHLYTSFATLLSNGCTTQCSHLAPSFGAIWSTAFREADALPVASASVPVMHAAHDLPLSAAPSAASLLPVDAGQGQGAHH